MRCTIIEAVKQSNLPDTQIMTALQKLLTTYRQASVTEREKGTYFEDLICTYLRNEATYRDLYTQVWRYADWARECWRAFKNTQKWAL